MGCGGWQGRLRRPPDTRKTLSKSALGEELSKPNLGDCDPSLTRYALHRPLRRPGGDGSVERARDAAALSVWDDRSRRAFDGCAWSRSLFRTRAQSRSECPRWL